MVMQTELGRKTVGDKFCGGGGVVGGGGGGRWNWSAGFSLITDCRLKTSIEIAFRSVVFFGNFENTIILFISGYYCFE